MIRLEPSNNLVQGEVLKRHPKRMVGVRLCSNESGLTAISQIYDKWHYLCRLYKTFLNSTWEILPGKYIHGRWILNIRTTLLMGLASQVILCRQNKSLFSCRVCFLPPLFGKNCLWCGIFRLFHIHAAWGLNQLECDFMCIVLITYRGKSNGFQLGASSWDNFRCLYEFIWSKTSKETH